MTVLVTALAVLAVLAALRRLVRTAVSLCLIAVLAGLSPQVFPGFGGSLRDVALEARDAVESVVGGDGTASASRADAIDGDTFELRAGGEPMKVRVALVDAGESSGSRYGEPTCGGLRATRFAQGWAERRAAVRLRGVSGLPREDRYGRRLARLVDRRGRDYGLAAVRSGWARIAVYEQPKGSGATYLARLRAAEGRARQARRGAWGVCDWLRDDGVR